MPSIDIKTLPPPASIDRQAVMQNLIKALSEAINTPPERIFAGWSFFDLQADGLNVESSWQTSSHPPIVAIDMFTGRTKAQKTKALEAIAAVLKRDLDFGGNPFIQIRDIANAQVITGGNVIDKS